jgi:hypothetical protein
MTASLYSPVRERAPGILLAPFGWAAEPLFAMTSADPCLAAELLRIDRLRLHLIGLVLAHMDGEPSSPEFLRFLIGTPIRDVLDRILGYRPLGLRRVLAHLPPAVMQAETYRNLIHLLDGRQSAKLLYHTDTITEPMIQRLHATPPALRRLVLKLGGQPIAGGLTPGLRLLVSRGVATDFDALVAGLAGAADASQFVAKLKGAIDLLPLPAPPPPCIAQAKRIDYLSEVIALAREWNNCLETFEHQIDSGECTVYLWEDPMASAACLVRRHGRFGFFLEDVKGPVNSEIEPERLEPIREAFADAGIPPASVIDYIENVLFFACLGRVRRVQRA